jgi:GntR family transcriptional regulator, transcriptional repressor for pyruvate dehydrogenase complex
VSIAPPFIPVKAPQAHVAVADAVRRRIALGAYVPGDRLPSERELAETLGVGRMTLRAAIRLLHDEGLLMTTKGRSGGTWVLEKGAPRTAAQRRALIRRYGDDIHKNFEFLLAVEPFACALCAERATAEQRAEILDLSRRQAPNVRAFRAHDSRFHLAIAEYCGNELFIEPVRNSRADFFLWADGLWTQREWDTQPAAERDFELLHEPIAQAIHRRDAAGAAELARVHLDNSTRSYERMLNR